MTRSAYFAFFLSYAASSPSSHGTVSSISTTDFTAADHSTAPHLVLRWCCISPVGTGAAFPGLLPSSTPPLMLKAWRVVSCWYASWVPPCLRKWILHRLSIGLWLFASCRLFSSTSASFLSTWSCRHLSRPCVSAVLQPDRTCWSEALMVPQRSQDCSVPSHWWRFLGLGSVVCCPNEETEPSLWQFPELCPVDCSVRDTLPSSPPPLLPLCHRPHSELLLLNPGDLCNNKVLPLLLACLGP